MKIARTALMLNSDGSIYHLHIQPGELAETILLVGDPTRVPLISNHFDRIHMIQQHREFIVHTGEISNQRLSVIGTGIGSGNIEIVMLEADALHNIDFATRTIKKKITPLRFIRLGTAGALQQDIPIDSLVLSEDAVAFDGLLNFYSHPQEAPLLTAIKKHFAPLAMATNAYIGHADTPLNTLFRDHCYSGITLTCIGFYGPQYRSLRAPLIADNVLQIANTFQYNGRVISNFEMETAAILGLGNILHHACCSISTIVGNRLTDVVSHHTTENIHKMIALVLEKISSRSHS